MQSVLTIIKFLLTQIYNLFIMGVWGSKDKGSDHLNLKIQEDSSYLSCKKNPDPNELWDLFVIHNKYSKDKISIAFDIPVEPCRLKNNAALVFRGGEPNEKIISFFSRKDDRNIVILYLTTEEAIKKLKINTYLSEHQIQVKYLEFFPKSKSLIRNSEQLFKGIVNYVFQYAKDSFPFSQNLQSQNQNFQIYYNDDLTVRINIKTINNQSDKKNIVLLYESPETTDWCSEISSMQGLNQHKRKTMTQKKLLQESSSPSSKLPKKDSKPKAPSYSEQSMQNQNQHKSKTMSKLTRETPRKFSPERKNRYHTDLIGLRNTGNTCYIPFDRNSTLQCLFCTPGLLDIIQTDQNFKQRNKPITKAFVALALSSKSAEKNDRSLYELQSSIRTKNFELFDGNQHDALMFLKVFLEEVNNELNRVLNKEQYVQPKVDLNQSLETQSDKCSKYLLSRENSIVYDLFGGQILNCVLKHTDSGYVQQSLFFEPFWDLSLSFKGFIRHFAEVHVNDMFHSFSKEGEIVEESDMRAQSLIWKFPKVLIIHLKRFEKVEDQYQKVNTPVIVPNYLNFEEITFNGTTRGGKSYELYGIVHHSGSLNSGHYTATCLNRENGKWYNFNDELVEEVSFRERGDPTAYILFYYEKCL